MAFVSVKHSYQFVPEEFIIIITYSNYRFAVEFILDQIVQYVCLVKAI